MRSHQDKATDLHSFLNRCIDSLLTHAPDHLNSPQPATHTQEPFFHLTYKGQHYFGPHRSILSRLFADQTVAQWASSAHQGDKIRHAPDRTLSLISIAWKLANSTKGLHSLPSLLLSTLTDTLRPFASPHWVKNPPPVRCHLCKGLATHTLSHLLVCPLLTAKKKNLRRTFQAPCTNSHPTPLTPPCMIYYGTIPMKTTKETGVVS